MAELRLTGPTEDGRALRLADADGQEHSLPLSVYLRRLVLEGTEQEDAEPQEQPAQDAPRGDEQGTDEQSPDDASGDEVTGGPDSEEEAQPPRRTGPSPLAPRITPPLQPEAASHAPLPPTAGAPSAAPLTATSALTGSPEPAASPVEARLTPGEPAAPRPSMTRSSAVRPAAQGERRTASGTPTAPLADQEDVRAAASQEAPPLSPREIQQRIRAGASVEQVARESGNPFARIRSYGFPVLAERGYVAQQARGTEIWVGGPDLYTDAIEDGGPSTLGELAEHRLRELGAPAGGLEWDAWREPSGEWTVTAQFAATGLRTRPTTEEPPARWTFRPVGRHLDPQNAWARMLSDAEAWDVFPEPPAPRTPSSETDAEAADADAPAAAGRRPDAPVDDAEAAVTPLGAHTPAADPDADLLEILRARRGQRVGADVASDDALAHLIARDAAERRTAAPTPLRPSLPDPAAEAAGARRAPGAHDAASSEVTEAEVDREVSRAQDEVAQVRAATADVADDRDDAEVAEPETAEIEAEASAGTPESTPAPGRPAMPAPTPRPRSRSASRRASVPSWDDIVFGRKGD
ncbi:septation protein SepH [Micrococcus sp. NPDC078436]|uniref:septation protein SepH n=1 Tax=Micrococcus sp. NPDC078436 TaxID=3154960 RepID=UPI00344FF643